MVSTLNKFLERVINMLESGVRPEIDERSHILRGMECYEEFLGKSIYNMCYEAARMEVLSSEDAYSSILRRSMLNRGDIQIELDETGNAATFREPGCTLRVEIKENSIKCGYELDLELFDDEYVRQYIEKQYLNKKERDFIIPQGMEEILLYYRQTPEVRKMLDNPVFAARYGHVLDAGRISEFEMKNRSETRPVAGYDLATVLHVFGEYAFRSEFTLHELSEFIVKDVPPVQSDIFIEYLKKYENMVAAVQNQIAADFYFFLGDLDFSEKIRFVYYVLSGLDEETLGKLTVRRLERLLGDEGLLLEYRYILDGRKITLGEQNRDAARGEEAVPEAVHAGKDMPEILPGVFREAIMRGQETPVTEQNITRYILGNEEIVKAYGIPEGTDDPIKHIADQKHEGRTLDWLRECGAVPDDDILYENIPKNRMRELYNDKFFNEWDKIQQLVSTYWVGTDKQYYKDDSSLKTVALDMYLRLGREVTERLITYVPEKISKYEYCKLLALKPLKEHADAISGFYTRDADGNYSLRGKLTPKGRMKLHRLLADLGSETILSPRMANEMLSDVEPYYSRRFAQYVEENLGELLKNHEMRAKLPDVQSKLIMLSDSLKRIRELKPQRKADKRERMERSIDF